MSDGSPVARPVSPVSTIDWSVIREFKGLPITDPRFGNRNTLGLVLWLQAADEATTTKRNANLWLGNQTSAELAAYEGGAFVTSYEQGDIWAVGEKPHITGAYLVYGDIRGRYNAIGRAKSAVGYPVSDETPCPDGRGRFNRFHMGVIYWTPQTGAWEVYGDILQHWAALGADKSLIGYPLTGEMGIPGGRMSSFEHGQITWRAQDHHLEALSYREKIVNKYNEAGGILSPLGLPVDANMPAVRSGNAFLTDFRGGSIAVPLDAPAPSAMKTKIVELWWRGLECQVRQEGEDELAGGVSVFCTEPWKLGPKWARIMPTSVLLYEGPPTSFLLTVGLVEIDDTFHSTADLSALSYENFFNGIPDIVGDLGAPAGSSVADAAARELQLRRTKFEDWVRREHLNFFPKSNDGADDRYPPGIGDIPETESNPVHRILRRDDDLNAISYTDSITVTATDDGGDPGVYAFYFECNVIDVQTPL